MGWIVKGFSLSLSEQQGEATQIIISISEWKDDIPVQPQVLSNGTLVEIPAKQHKNNRHIL